MWIRKIQITSDALVLEVWFLEDSRSESNFLSIDILQNTPISLKTGRDQDKI